MIVLNQYPDRKRSALCIYNSGSSSSTPFKLVANHAGPTTYISFGNRAGTDRVEGFIDMLPFDVKAIGII